MPPSADSNGQRLLGAMRRRFSRKSSNSPTITAARLRLDIAPEDAILRQASPGNYNLIVRGVGRQAGETLFFGRVAAAVLENSDRSLLFVSNLICLGKRMFRKSGNRLYGVHGCHSALIWAPLS